MYRVKPHPRRANLWSLVATAALLMASSGCKPAETPPTSPAEAQGTSTASQETTSQKPATGATGKPAVAKPSARQILDSMVAKYKTAASYADKATVRIQASVGDQKVDQSFNLLVAMVRPNKIRMEVYQGTVVCDGKDLWAFSGFLPDQVLKHSAPQDLSFENIFSDELLANALTQGPTQTFSWVPPQLLLLWAKDPLKTMLYQAQEPVLVGAKDLDGQSCHQIGITRPEGKYLLWIDTQESLLRRIDYPIEELARELGTAGPMAEGSLVAEFREARLNPDINADAFRFEPDPSAQVVEHLMNPALRMLGKPVPDFEFVGLDGGKITPKSLEGKATVLDFWATWCGPCRMNLPLMEKVYDEYKDNDKVRFLAVSVDDPSATDDQLRQAMADLKVNLPISRDPQQHVAKSFHSLSIPTMFLIGSNGVVQYTESGANPKLTAELRERLSTLLEGHDLYPELLNRAEEQRKDNQALLENWLKQGLFTAPMSDAQEIPKAEIAQRSEPKAFTLTSLWKNSELKDPGNILVVPRADGSSQVFVLDGVKNVAEIAPEGRVTATHSLELEDQEVVSFLRTAVDGRQKRYFAASGMMQMRTHVFDESWKQFSVYPSDALQNRHAGILDVQLADLEGKGTLVLCIGYLGVLGVQAASLEGKRLWPNRSLDTVMRIAVLDPNAEGKRNLLCTNTRGPLRIVDAEGNSREEIQVPETNVQWIVAADLDGSPPQKLCGLSFRDVGVCEVVGLNLKGERLWAYPLPKGVPTRPIEQIVPGQLKPSGPGQWLVPAADGSIHVIAADGQPIDRFNYGVELHGLATAQWNGQPVLLVARAGSVEAFRISWPNP